MFPRSSLHRVLLASAVVVAAAFVAGGAASAGAFTDVGGPIPGPPASSGPVTSAPSDPVTPSDPVPSGSEPICVECGCVEVSPLPSQITAPIAAPVSFVGRSAGQPQRAPGDTVVVNYVFTIKTDADAKPTLVSVTADRAPQRNSINNETITLDSAGCYLLYFDSRTVATQVLATPNGKVVPQPPKTMPDGESGLDFTRYGYSVSPRVKNGTIVIRIRLKVNI